MAPRILMVDNNPCNRQHLESLLKPYGFEIVRAGHGEALASARLCPPDLIVSDISMPVMDGYKLCRALKSDDRLKNIPFVFYTTLYTSPADEALALSLGASCFILKSRTPDIVAGILMDILKEKLTPEEEGTDLLRDTATPFRQYPEAFFKDLEKRISALQMISQEIGMLTQRYRLSLENSKEVIYSINRHYKITSISPSIEEVFGYKPQDYIGRPVADFGRMMTPGSWLQAESDIEFVLSGKSSVFSVYHFIARDGTVKFGEVSVSPLICDGKIMGIVFAVRDVTERRWMELERERLVADLHQTLSRVDLINSRLPVYASREKSRDDHGR